MRIKWKGQDLGTWSGKPSLKECRRIKSELGLGPNEWLEKFGEMDPEAWSIFVALMLSRNGEHVNLEDVDGEYDDLELIPDKDEQDAEKADEGKAPPIVSENENSSESKASSSTPDSPTST